MKVRYHKIYHSERLIVLASVYKDIRYKWLIEKGFNVFGDEHQLAYMQSLWAPKEEVQAVFCDSKSGTGKTTLAVLAGAYEVEKATDYDKIVYIRNAVATRDQGFLPGGVKDKERPFMKPFISALDKVQPGLFEVWAGERNRDDDDDEEFQGIKAEAITTSYERGVTYENAFVILDEAQNMSLHELHTIYTRCADSCKITTIGSTQQLDDPKIQRINGLLPFEIFIQHYRGTKTKEHTLLKNYRGSFAAHADEIQETIKMMTIGGNE